MHSRAIFGIQGVICMKQLSFGLIVSFVMAVLGCGGGGGSHTPVSAPPVPVITTLFPVAGEAGSLVTINGSHLTGTTGVQFNGTTSTFTFINDTQVTATVPVGATSGACTLSATGGKATSPSSFIVTVPGPRSFWVNDLDDSQTWTQAFFLEAYQNARCTVWVREADKGLITTQMLKNYGDYFAQHSWPDVTTYVHMPTEFFGDPGNRINILFYRAQEGVAGYFWSKDFYSQADLDAAGAGDRIKSNQGNYFYLNIDTAVNDYDQAGATLFTEGTLTHEFQHMCNAHYFNFDSVGEKKTREMDAWADEFCSVTAESIFAGQLDVYIPSYKGNYSFKIGANDFLQWRNDFNQYTSVSLLGSYFISQIPEANRPNFFKRFLDHTQTEGTTGSQVLTSVEDLLVTLQDPQIGWTPTGWASVSNYTTETAQVRDNWSATLKSFLTGLTGQNTAYNAYVTAHSHQTMTPACAPARGGVFALKPSGFFIGKTSVANLSSDCIRDASADASGKFSAYTLVYNASLPSQDLLGDKKSILEGATTTVTGTQFARPAQEILPAQETKSLAPFKYNRAMSPHLAPFKASAPDYRAKAAVAPSRPTILGSGNPLNGGNTTAGYNYCFYVPR